METYPGFGRGAAWCRNGEGYLSNPRIIGNHRRRRMSGRWKGSTGDWQHTPKCNAAGSQTMTMFVWFLAAFGQAHLGQGAGRPPRVHVTLREWRQGRPLHLHLHLQVASAPGLFPSSTSILKHIADRCDLSFLHPGSCAKRVTAVPLGKFLASAWRSPRRPRCKIPPFPNAITIDDPLLMMLRYCLVVLMPLLHPADLAS